MSDPPSSPPPPDENPGPVSAVSHTPETPPRNQSPQITSTTPSGDPPTQPRSINEDVRDSSEQRPVTPIGQEPMASTRSEGSSRAAMDSTRQAFRRDGPQRREQAKQQHRVTFTAPPAATRRKRTSDEDEFDNEKAPRIEAQNWVPHLTPKKTRPRNELLRRAPPSDYQLLKSISPHSSAHALEAPGPQRGSVGIESPTRHVPASVSPPPTEVRRNILCFTMTHLKSI
ncbi:hypothetical protein NUW54_g12652 [Trametes sanguinea]|uniref:Uncharacterized protein n=1 Tax=Trametes sanguinea TaxID=158606 RepID=A0ACC1MW94_9APHY|nr:hypothetical protein NUW54_g12652 [Trametes sanguinea]